MDIGSVVISLLIAIVVLFILGLWWVGRDR